MKKKTVLYRDGNIEEGKCREYGSQKSKEKYKNEEYRDVSATNLCQGSGADDELEDIVQYFVDNEDDDRVKLEHFVGSYVMPEGGGKRQSSKG